VAIVTPHYNSPQEVLRDADVAMYEAKRSAANVHVVFAGEMREKAVDALELRTDLQNAVTRNEFFLVYQPICNSPTGAVVGFEALIRWQHPVRGTLSPLVFIGTAEETGLIRDIGRWVLLEACKQMRRWQDRFPALDLRLSVNASVEELKDAGFTGAVTAILKSTGLDPRSLELELTESVFLYHPEVVGDILSKIRAVGARVALDDFGTGYSSLSYLDRYEVDTIKIDRSFLSNMATQKRTMAIVEAVVGLGRALDLDIVAEGVEDQAQLIALRAMGCGLVQGYLLGRPVPAGEATRVLETQCGSDRRSKGQEA
jgi:EAL domain-containing protein (putative c-di-GMP-specific phosphodiesterase class I)